MYHFLSFVDAIQLRLLFVNANKYAKNLTRALCSPFCLTDHYNACCRVICARTRKSLSCRRRRVTRKTENLCERRLFDTKDTNQKDELALVNDEMTSRRCRRVVVVVTSKIARITFNFIAWFNDECKSRSSMKKRYQTIFERWCPCP